MPYTPSPARIVSLPGVIGAEWFDEEGLRCQLYVPLPEAGAMYLAIRADDERPWKHGTLVYSPERFGFVPGRRPRLAQMANIAQSFRQFPHGQGVTS